jgi:hypothetical protein
MQCSHATNAIKNWLKIRFDKKKSFKVHRVEKVIYEHDPLIHVPVVCREKRQEPSEVPHRDSVMEPGAGEMDEGNHFSLDGFIFGRTSTVDVDASVRTVVALIAQVRCSDV